MAKKIMVVDDDRSVLRVIRRYLDADGYAVVAADNGSSALMIAREAMPDAILIDAQMPGLDGHAVCRVLKKDRDLGSIPIVLMSGALVQDRHVLSGFEGGADDYVLKPFSLPVLAARLKAVMRRCEAPKPLAKGLSRSGVELDDAGRTARVDGRSIALTRKEFDLLYALMFRAGRVLSVPYLLETVWGYEAGCYTESATIEVHVSHLRRKLGPRAARRLVNFPGLGYKFDDGR